MSELDRIGDLLVPYLCERTGLSRSVVEQFLDAQSDFWDAQLRRLGLIIEELEEDEDDA